MTLLKFWKSTDSTADWIPTVPLDSHVARLYNLPCDQSETKGAPTKTQTGRFRWPQLLFRR